MKRECEMDFLESSKKIHLNFNNFEENVIFATKNIFINDIKICKECLRYIFLICSELNFINEENFKIFCTACLYFMIVVRKHGLKLVNNNNSNSFYYKKSPVKSYLVNLCLNCIIFSYKVCKDEKLGKVFNYVILNGKQQLNKTYLFCESELDFKQIEEYLKSDRVIGEFVWDFITITDEPIKTLKIIAPNKKIKSFDVLIRIYTNPFFCYYSIYDKCVFCFNENFEKRKEMSKIFFY